MTAEMFYKELKEKFISILKENDILDAPVKITTKSLTVEEAIGKTKRKDFPIITGKEVMIQAECQGSFGQAFTDAPTAYSGSLKEICEMDLENDDRARALFIAALNAIMSYLGKVECTIHCRAEGPELCSKEIVEYIKENYNNPKIALIGYQPAMLENLFQYFEIRVLDLDPINVGEKRYGVVVEDGIKNYQDVVDWADLILCTGSTICNGSIVNFIDLDKEVLFFGTTLAGAAPLMNLKRICYTDKYGTNK
jgi:uncharacterized protein (DUF4213/DUF364 family)